MFRSDSAASRTDTSETTPVRCPEPVRSPARDSQEPARSWEVQGGAQWALAIGLIAAGAGLRVGLQHLPNFAPIAALALFAGYTLRSARLALAVPVVAMVLSDLVIGGYAWQMMLLVYGCLALPVAFRRWLRRWLDLKGESLAATGRSLAGLMTCSLTASLLFFALTNFGTWYGSEMYAPTWAGLAECYAMALPFFRYTLTGDLFFGGVLFGSYALVAHRLQASAPCRLPQGR